MSLGGANNSAKFYRFNKRLYCHFVLCFRFVEKKGANLRNIFCYGMHIEVQWARALREAGFAVKFLPAHLSAFPPAIETAAAAGAARATAALALPVTAQNICLLSNHG